MTRFCFCLIAMLVCCSTAEAQFRRLAKPRARQSRPLKNTTQMVSSILAEELTKAIFEGLGELLAETMGRESGRFSKGLVEAGHPQVKITIDPDFSHWTSWISKLENTETEDQQNILFIPAANLSESDIAQLAPGSKRFVGAVGFNPEAQPKTDYLTRQTESLYRLSSHLDDPNILWADTPLLLLTIAKTADGKVMLLGYGAGPQPIVSTEWSTIDKAKATDKKKSPAKPYTIEKNDALRYDVARPLNDDGLPADHFFKGDIRQREPLTLQISLFGKYQARF